MRAYVWKRNIYKRRFKCECGQNLMPGRQPAKSTMALNQGGRYLICANCGQNVAKLKEII